jgi:hypothetical protein
VSAYSKVERPFVVIRRRTLTLDASVAVVFRFKITVRLNDMVIVVGSLI